MSSRRRLNMICTCNFIRPFIFLGLLGSASVSLPPSSAWGQMPSRRPALGNFPAVEPYIPEAGVPASAMLTADGRELATQLRNLRRSESVIGLNHPARASIDTEISVLKGRLAAIGKQNSLATAGNLAADSEPDTDTDTDVLTTPEAGERRESMRTSTELRKLLAQLQGTIEKLEVRVLSLERRMVAEPLPAPDK